MADQETIMNRRRFIRRGILGGGALGLSGTLVGLAVGGKDKLEGDDDMVWQLDPAKCTKCGKCATLCVLSPSAVKCIHAFDICGYCDLCTGYFNPQPNKKNTGAENQLCPVGAIKRTFVEDPYYEYTIDEDLCIGCAKCVEGCEAFGNASLFLQVRHDRCINCNECAIAAGCPADAFRRVPASEPYIVKKEHGES